MTMSQREKKVKRIVINASNTKKINNDLNKNSNNKSQPANKNCTVSSRSPLSQQQMETSSYRLSRVRNEDFSNRFVENENKESFCFSFFRDNPDMLDTRPPSEKLLEYYEKLGIPIENNSVKTKSYQKSEKIKVNSDDIIKFNYDVKYSHSDNFSYISYPFDLPSSFTRKEKIQLLSQMIPLEFIVHGKDSFELLRAHIMIAYFYNRTQKPQPAIRHLNEARKIQGKGTNTSNSKNSSKFSPSAVSKSSRASRKPSPSSIKSQRKVINMQSEYNQQKYVKADDYFQNEEIEKEIDDEISIEFSNAYLMLAMDNSTSAYSKSKYTKNAIISLSRFIDETESNNNNNNNESQHLNEHLSLRKDLAQARLLFVQKKYEESAKYYENLLSNLELQSNNENESKTSKNDQKSINYQQFKNDKKNANESVRLDELVESADLKVEAAENIKMIIKNQFNIIKEKQRKIRSSRDFDDINYEDLIDDIDYALDLYYEARDSYEDAGLDDNVEECENFIQKLENEKEEVYTILDEQQVRQIEQEHEEEEEEEKKIDRKVKKGQIAENTIEVNFGSSSSLDEKETEISIDQKQTENQQNKTTFSDKNENKLDVASLAPLLDKNEKKNNSSASFHLIQNDNEYGSDENEDESKIKNGENEKEKETNKEANFDEENKKIEMNSGHLKQLDSVDNEEKERVENGSEKILNNDIKNTVTEITNSLIITNDENNLSNKSLEIQKNKENEDSF